ncbi:hypothetical protein [Sphaerobacter sp.]|uniref:hypothetical protein n=1 Tax=Sphaerobacter sp. TaxID=2099654 RepID=UPI001E16A465|nr:hypothetical protein [Sphaerobacter sp.]MBX5446076.1 hypothetical protein [Sphaerobacter sp.]
MRERLQRGLDRLENALARQSDIRRAGILGVLFGLLLCVIVLASCALLFAVVSRLQ